MRESLGIAPEDLVIGHTGRFVTPKNHGFLAEIVAEAARRRPGVRVLLVGDGPNRAATEARLQDLVSPRAPFSPASGPTCRLCFRRWTYFSSRRSGRGCRSPCWKPRRPGLPCVISDVISDETDVVPGLTTRIPLAAGAAHWASEVLAAAAGRRLPRAGFIRGRKQQLQYSPLGGTTLCPLSRLIRTSLIALWRERPTAPRTRSRGKVILSLHIAALLVLAAIGLLVECAAARSGAYAVSRVRRRIDYVRLGSRELVLAPPHAVRTLSPFHLFGRTL